MSAISTYITKIRNAIYGREVRGAIADAIEECYSNVTDASIREDAFSAAIRDAVDNNIIANDALTPVTLVYNTAPSNYTTLGQVLTPGIYNFTPTIINNFLDRPETFVSSSGILIVIASTASFREQILATNTQMFIRTTSGGQNRAWTEVSNYSNLVTTGNVPTHIADGQFEQLPGGTYIIDDNTGVTIQNYLPTFSVVDRNGITAVTTTYHLTEGTLVSESPIAGEYGGYRYSPGVGIFPFNIHFYCVDTVHSTPNRAFHFIKHAEINASSDNTFTITCGNWIDVSERPRELHPEDTVYYNTVAVTNATRLTDSNFLTGGWTNFRLKTTSSSLPDLDLPTGCTLTPGELGTCALTSYPSNFELTSTPSGITVPYGYTMQRKAIYTQKLEKVEWDSVRVWYRQVFWYALVRSSPYSRTTHTIAGDWIEH